MSRIRKLLVYFRQAVVIGIITFLLGEITLRAYHLINPLPIFYSNEYNRFRPQPFSADYDGFQLNSKGFKDVERTPQKPDGTFRILGIGDSFASGIVPYANNYLTLVEEGLNRGGRKVEVLNMGIPGTGPRNYLSLLFQEGLDLAPDMVLVSFFIGNDFEQGGLRRKLLSRSYLASAIKFFVDFNIKFQDQTFGGGKYDDNARSFTDDAYLELESHRSQIYLKGNTGFDADLAAAFATLVEIKALCDMHNIRLMIVFIPDEVQVNSPLQKKVAAALGLSLAAFDFRKPNNLLAAKLTEHGIDYIDLLDAFAAASERERLYRVNDSHWNIRGNEMASKIILRKLSEPPRGL